MSLVEILSIIIILGIMASIALPTWRDLAPRIALDKAKQELISLLRQTQQQAITQNNTICFNIKKDFVLNEKLTWGNISFDNNKACFLPSGGAQSPGLVIIKTIHNNKEKTIEVKPSGYIK